MSSELIAITVKHAREGGLSVEEVKSLSFGMGVDFGELARALKAAGKLRGKRAVPALEWGAICWATPDGAEDDWD